MNKVKLPAFAIIIIIVAFFSLFTFTLYNTRAICETRLVLEIKSNKADTTGYYISNISTLDSVVTRLNSKFDDTNLLSIYERERQHYILLLTVLGLLLTLSIAYTIVKHIVEKDEVLAQEKRIAKLETSLETELNNLKKSNTINHFRNFNDVLLGAKTSFIDEDNNAIIDNLDAFIKYLKEINANMFELIKNNYADKDLQEIAVDVRNLLNATVVYAKEKKYTNNLEWNRKSNEAFKALTIWIEDTIGVKKYGVLKENIRKLPYVEWVE